MPYALILCRNFPSMRAYSLIFFISLISVFSCKNAAPPKVQHLPVTSKLSDVATHSLMSVVADYYQLKNALAATNQANAGKTATLLIAVTDSFTTALAGDSINKIVLQPYLDTIVTQAKLVKDIQDPTCERQRQAFSVLSSSVYAMLKNADLKNAGIYHQYCPMAFNDKGAFWLSEEREIKNPYFGKKMLECGEVKDSL